MSSTAPLAGPPAGSTAPPRVQAGSFLTLHYRLSAPAGTVVQTEGGPPATLTLGMGELAPAVEARLVGLEEGAQVAFDLPAGAAFGERNPQLVQWVSRRLLQAQGAGDETYAVGEAVQFPTPDGQGRYAGIVRQVAPDGAVLFDFNHPLAGQPVRFEARILAVL